MATDKAKAADSDQAQAQDKAQADAQADVLDTGDQPEQHAGEPLEKGTEQGYIGTRADETPLDAYTLAGVTSNDQAAEADASAVETARAQAASDQADPDAQSAGAEAAAGRAAQPPANDGSK